MSDPRAGCGEVSFDSHNEAITKLASALVPWFELHREVELGSSQIDGKTLYADLVAIDREFPDRVIAFEAKCGFYRMSEYSHAIKQAVDYRMATLLTAKAGLSLGQRVSAIFVFPRWKGGHDNKKEYSLQAAGMEILAHHFRVGFAEYGDDTVTLVMNEKRLWSAGTWSKTAPSLLAAKDRVGSGKFLDPLKATQP